MKVQHHRPSIAWFLALGREHTNIDIRSLGNPSLDGDILRLAHVQQRTTTRDQDTATSRCSNGLKMHLLKVDDMLVVESNIFRIQKVLDGVMQGIRWLRVGGGHCQQLYLVLFSVNCSSKDNWAGRPFKPGKVISRCR